MQNEVPVFDRPRSIGGKSCGWLKKLVRYQNLRFGIKVTVLNISLNQIWFRSESNVGFCEGKNYVPKLSNFEVNFELTVDSL